MGFKNIRELPTPAEIKAMSPPSREVKVAREKQVSRINNVLQKKEDKFLVLIGPCSAHDEEAVCSYAVKLAAVQEKVKDKVIIIPRIYTNKPRTTGEGYKGIAHQPDHLKSPNLTEGILAMRKMHLRAFSESGLACSDEMLYPGNHPYLDDLLCYVAVGARSVENQQHRLTASGLDIPVGMKNPTSGDIKVALNSVLAAQLPHVFSYNGWEVITEGNSYAHLILRGAIDHYGQTIPNYHHEDLILTASEYEKRNLLNPAIIVDTNHDNSGKRFMEQPRIAQEVLRSRNNSPLLRRLICGFMIESYLEEGSQKSHENVFGKSITDPCLGWKESEELIYMIANNC